MNESRRTTNPVRFARWFVVARLVVLLAWSLWPDSDSTKLNVDGGSTEREASPRFTEPLSKTSRKSTPRAKTKKFSSGLTDEEIEALGTQFREGKDGQTRRRAFDQLLAGLSVENAQKVREQIADVPRHSAEFREFHQAWGRAGGKDALLSAAGTSRQASEATMAGWASVEPTAALEFFDRLQLSSHNGDGSTNHLSKEYLRLGLVEGLAEADPNMATDFVQEQFDAKEVGDKRAGDMIRAVANSIVAQKGLEAAASWAATAPDDLRNEALAGVARKFAASDVEATLEWLGSLGDRDHQGAAYFHTFSTWAGEDPAAASDYIAAMPDSYRRNEAIIATALQSMREDSGLALEWIETITKPTSRNRGFSYTFNAWARQDAVAASEYLAEMADSPERDHAIHGFAGSVVVRDPTTAIAWADQIGDAQLRESSLVTVALSFFENDPAAATTWLPDSGFPMETVERILNPSAEDQHLLNFLTQQ